MAKKTKVEAPAPPMPKVSRAYDIFVGTMVTLIVRGIRGKEQGKVTNIMLGGYLLDECDNYFYIGANSLEIHSAVNKRDVAAIISGDAESLQQDEFNLDFEVPDGSSEH